MNSAARIPLQVLAIGLALGACWTLAGWLTGSDHAAALGLLAQAAPFAAASLVVLRASGWSQRRTIHAALALVGFALVATLGYGVILDDWNDLHAATFTAVPAPPAPLPPVAA